MQLATETDENFYLHQQHHVIALHSIMYIFQYNYSLVSEALGSEIQGYRNRYNLIVRIKQDSKELSPRSLERLLLRLKILLMILQNVLTCFDIFMKIQGQQ